MQCPFIIDTLRIFKGYLDTYTEDQIHTCDNLCVSIYIYKPFLGQEEGLSATPPLFRQSCALREKTPELTEKNCGAISPNFKMGSKII